MINTSNSLVNVQKILSEKDAFSLCRDTWRGYRPLFHYSESREGKNPRAHADYVKQLPDTYGLDDIDIDFEFKMKDKAFLNLK